MAVSYVGSGTGTTTATVPTHSIGDLILGWGFRSGSNTAPSLPAGYTQILTNTVNSCGALLAYRIATSTSDTSGTWTNATDLIISAYTGTNTTSPIGGSNVASGTTQPVTYPVVTMVNAGGTSWVAGLGASRTAAATLSTPPTGMINRGSHVATSQVAGHDTNGGVTGWANTTENVGGAANWACATVEMIATAPVATISGSTLMMMGV